jgi:hypothetical protein
MSTADHRSTACKCSFPVEDLHEGEALGLAKYINAPGKGTTIAQVLYGFVGDHETPSQHFNESLIGIRNPINGNTNIGLAMSPGRNESQGESITVEG